MAETWTIAELAEEAAARLAAGGLAQESGRVRDLPSPRLIRWYTTIGLLDPPIRNGRHALYNRRHLAQLVAVKRRQAEGRPLADIQAELAGAADRALEEIAGIPELPPAPAGRESSRPRFWAERPAVPQPPPTTLNSPTSFNSPTTCLSGAALSGPGAPASSPAGDAGLVHGVRLAPGVTLLLGRTEQTPSADDLAALATAARPLLAELARRGLISEGDDQ